MHKWQKVIDVRGRCAGVRVGIQQQPDQRNIRITLSSQLRQVQARQMMASYAKTIDLTSTLDYRPDRGEAIKRLIHPSGSSPHPHAC
jgi:hypothetical protein